jgi:hypothetical protein
VATGERRYSVMRRMAQAPVGAVAASPAVVPCLLALAAIVALGATEGGYFATTWYPAALLMLALLGLLAFVRQSAPTPRLVLAAAGLLFGYALWSYLSIAWAGDKGTAVDGAGRTLMYAAVFALFALRPIAGGPAIALVAAYGLAVGGVGLVELLRLDAAADPSSYFLEARLAQPVGYHNGDVALWFSGFFPCAYLATRRELAAVLRGLLLGSAGLLLGLALMGQSRGWFFSVPPAVLVFVALVPGRGRAVASLAALTVAGLTIAGPVLRVHDDFLAGAGPAPLVDNAARAIEIAALWLLVGGVVAALLDARVRLSERTSRVVSGAVVALAALAVGAGGAMLAIRADDPVQYVKDSWRDFKEGAPLGGGETRFLNSLGSGRYDIWRVAWQRFQEEPVRGVGADNFQEDYLARARTGEQPRYPHSVELRTLVQTGIVGSLLLLGAFACAGLAALRGRLRGPPLTRVATAAALVVPVYWLIHGSVDWFWEIPALGAGAFAMLGLAAGSAPRAEGPPRRLGMPFRIGLGVVAVAAALALLSPWVAERDMRAAAREWRASPDAAFRRLDRAKALNPLAARPYLYEGSIWLRLGRLGAAREAYSEALERNERDWYATLELGAIASMQGDRPAATRLLSRAARLLPRDETTRAALARLRSGGRLDVRKINARLRAQTRKLVDPR